MMEEMTTNQSVVKELDLTLQPRPAPRYKVWLPLATQQLRLRSLYQVIGFHLETDKNAEVCWFYFTLHRSSMSSPFYTSGTTDNISPKWSNLEVPTLHATGLSTANEVVLRLWRKTVADDPTTDVTVFTWGISFTGLVYMGPKLSNNLDSLLHHNSLIFHLHGGYFVPSYCLVHPPEFRRYLYMSVNNSEITDSYTVNKLSKLRNMMQSLKEKSESVQALRDRIISGECLELPKFKQTTLNKLLQPKRISKEKKLEIIRIRKELEIGKFRTKLLEQEIIKKVGQVRSLYQKHLNLMEDNQNQGSILMERFRELNKDIERLREWRKNHIQERECYVQLSAQLAYKRRQYITDLQLIFPIRMENEKKLTINNVHLPDSEDLDSCNDNISVALGYVAQTTQIIANILNIPIRYPIIHYGSKSKIIDHITNNIPDKERQFPLFSRSKDKVQFDYGVYLLNKNISQLRWYCGLPTNDLRATLLNLITLINMKPNQTLDNSNRTFSGSSLDTDNNSSNNDNNNKNNSNNSNSNNNSPLTPTMKKILIDKEFKLFNYQQLQRPNRTINQFKYSRKTLGSSLDQGLDEKSTTTTSSSSSSSLIKRICISQESGINDKLLLTLPQYRLSNNSDENIFNIKKNLSSINHTSDDNKFQLHSKLIESDIDIEITIPTSVINTKDSNSRQRSSNSISSCEMALPCSNLLNNSSDQFKDNTNLTTTTTTTTTTDVITSTSSSSSSLTTNRDVSQVETLINNLTLIQPVDNNLINNESIVINEIDSTTSVIEKTDLMRNDETLLELNKSKEIKCHVTDSFETFSNLSFNNPRSIIENIDNRIEIASSCPESANPFYDKSDESVPKMNWRTESNPSLKFSVDSQQESKKFGTNIPVCLSQSNKIQEALNDYRASSEFIDSIRRSSENVFARTEALANKKTSFKVMKPRS